MPDKDTKTKKYRKISIYISIIINYNRESILQFVQTLASHSLIVNRYQEKYHIH